MITSPKSFSLLSTIICATIATSSLQGATIVYFDGTSVSEDSVIGSSADSANVTATDIAISGTGTVASDLVPNQSNAGLNTPFNGMAVAPALRLADFDATDQPVVSFTINVDPGFQFNLTDINGIGLRTGNSGALIWGFEIDGTAVGSQVNLTPQSNADTDIWFTFGGSVNQSITGSVTISVVYSNLVGNNQQMGLDEITLEGTVTPIPEAGSIGFLCLAGLIFNFRRRRR